MNITYKIKDEINLKVLKKYGYTLRRKNGFERYEKLVDHKRIDKKRYTRDYIYYICIVGIHRQIYINVYLGGFYGVDIIKYYEKEEINEYIKDLIKADLVEKVGDE